nr:GNAT family protein [Streptomyces fodineus]
MLRGPLAAQRRRAGPHRVVPPHGTGPVARLPPGARPGFLTGSEARGRGIGTRARLQLVRYLFAHTPVMRIEADTESENVAQQRALEKAGFTREGVLRGVVFRDGRWRDGVARGVLGHDPLPADV